MNRFRLAMVGLAALALASCSTLQHLTSPGVSDAKTVAAAEISYTEVAKAEKLWAESGKATPAQANVAKALDESVYSTVKAGREAVANHDSAATAVALDLFNNALPKLRSYIASGGANVQ